MISALTLIAVPVVIGAAFGAISLKFGAEDRPGFTERTPLV